MKFRIEDFCPEMQAQIRAKLATLPPATCGDCQTPQQPLGVARGVVFDNDSEAVKKRQSNKTEQRFHDHHLRGMNAHYEAITFHLAGGSRYTPDWIWWSNGKIYAAEVKGSYRLHSHGRARTAFRECVAQFSTFVFWWAVWSGREWKIERYNDD